MIKHFIIQSGDLDNAASRTTDSNITDLLNEIDLPQGGEGVIRYADDNDNAPLALFDPEYDNVIPREEADALLELAGSNGLTIEELTPVSSWELTKEMAETFRESASDIRYNLQFDGVCSEAIDVVEKMVDNVLGFDDMVTANTYEETSWGAFISDRGGLYVLRPGEIETILENLK